MIPTKDLHLKSLWVKIHVLTSWRYK